MQLPPLTSSDASLLLAIGAIILLITAELSSPYYGRMNLNINRKKIKNAALATGMLFLITAAIEVINVITAP
jgi:hypothetical protein